MHIHNLYYRIIETCCFIAAITLYISSLTLTIMEKKLLFLYPIFMSLHYYLCIFFDENKLDESYEMCSNCKIFHIKNVEHCEICRKCFFKRDHHCWLIGKCINYNNYKDFFWFLFFTTTLLALLAFKFYSFICLICALVLFCYFAFLNCVWSFNFLTKEFDSKKNRFPSIKTWWNVVFDGSFQNVIIGFFPFRKLNINFMNQSNGEEFTP